MIDQQTTTKCQYCGKQIASVARSLSAHGRTHRCPTCKAYGTHMQGCARSTQPAKAS